MSGWFYVGLVNVATLSVNAWQHTTVGVACSLVGVTGSLAGLAAAALSGGKP